MSHANKKNRLAAEDALQSIKAALECSASRRIEDLETRNNELEAFSYSVSHDLRTPLRHITGFLKLLKKRLQDNPDEETLRYMDMISEASNRMGKLIDDLLDFSHAGYKEMQKSQVNLNSIIKEEVMEIREDLKERVINWEIEELPDILGDQSLLRLVIINLLSNAVKFTRNCTRAEIKIGCEAGTEEYTCFIKDNGVGFDMKHVHRLFCVFQRLHAREEFEGTGIGLANVQRIIRRHGGRVWAEGVVGQGATFYFTIPKTKSQEYA